MTDKEVQLAGDALLLRASEQGGRALWFAIDEAKCLPEAHELHERGYLQRRWNRERGDLLWRATDRAMTAQELHATVLAGYASRN